MTRQTTTRRTLLARLGTACAVPSVVAASAAATDGDRVESEDDIPETCVTPFQDSACMLCCCGYDEPCPDKCCFCMCA